MRVAPFVTMSLVLLAACGPKPETAAETNARMTRESAAAKTVIDSLNVAFDSAFRTGRGEQAAAQYTEDAYFMAGPYVQIGRAPLAAWVTQMGAHQMVMAMRAKTVTANGPLAIERGVYVLSHGVAMDSGAPGAETGSYLIQWRLVGGHWLRAAQVATTPHPMQPPTK